MVAGTEGTHAHAHAEASADDVIAVPLNTRRSTSWATNTWDAWARDVGSGRSAPTADQLAGVSAVDFNDALCRFVAETRRGNGDLYPAKSVYLLCTGLLRFVRSSCRRPDLNMFDHTDDVFADFRRALERRMAQLTGGWNGLTYPTPLFLRLSPWSLAGRRLHHLVCSALSTSRRRPSRSSASLSRYRVFTSDLSRSLLTMFLHLNFSPCLLLLSPSAIFHVPPPISVYVLPIAVCSPLHSSPLRYPDDNSHTQGIYQSGSPSWGPTWGWM